MINYLAVEGQPLLTDLTVEGSSSSDLVRITQTGTGNALLVEDSASPDSTPFVISNTGSAVIGRTAPVLISAGVQPNLQILGDTVPTSSLMQVRYNNDTSAPNIYLGHSRSTTIGSHTTVATGDNLGNLQFVGSDGTNFISSASVTGGAEGTISTGVVPGRLIFSTANSSGTLTERMRIDSAGRVAIGTTPSAGYSFYLANPITGLTTSYGFVAGGTVQSDVTSGVNQFISGGNTAAAAFTLGSFNHFAANGVTTPGAGSTITSQTGFYVLAGTTGATNNYGFRGLIPIGPNNNWNLYMDGAAPNYLAGNLGIGISAPAVALHVASSTTVGSQNNVGAEIGTSGGTSSLLLGSITGNTPFIGSEGAAPLYLNTNGVNRINITADGNVAVDTNTLFVDAANNRVGIGTTTPSTALQVVGTITATSYTGALASAVTATTQTAGNNTTAVATTAFVTTADALKANIASPTFTGTVAGNPAAGTTTTATDGFGYMGLPQNASLTGNIAVVASDAGKHIYSTATRTATIPANSNVAMPIGTTITFVAGSGATVTIAITTDTLLLAGPGTTGSRTLAPFGIATAVKIASTTWIISGNGLT